MILSNIVIQHIESSSRSNSKVKR